MKIIRVVCAALCCLLAGCMSYTPLAIPTPIPFSPPPAVTPPYTVDTVTSASPKESSDPKALLHGLSESGGWIFSVLSDVTLREELTVSGVFHDKGDTTLPVYRKLALYAQDTKHNVTDTYTLTVPKITVKSPNFRIQNGTVRGDIYVEADGFELNNTTLMGDLIFASETYQDSAKLTTAILYGETGVES
jgi:hypothetical protein